MAFWKIITAPFRFIFWILRLLVRFTVENVRKIRTFFAEEEEDTSLPDAFAKTVQNPSGVLYHLNELRKNLFRGVVYMVITTALSFVFITKILDFLTVPVGGIKVLQAVDVTEPIGAVMKVALLSGFTLAFPLIAFEIWLFVAPGLKRGERVFSLFAIPVAVVFFVGGMAFAYFIMLKPALSILLRFANIQSIPRPNSYFPFVTSLMFWLGMFFEFPLVIFVLARLGMVKGRSLLNQWRIAVVIIAILAAAITTTVDPINMSLVMLPMILLYFLSILLAFIAERRRPVT